jgi:hypothetical protein
MIYDLIFIIYDLTFMIYDLTFMIYDLIFGGGVLDLGVFAL